MINFIGDYYKLGISFTFEQCENCDNIKITLQRKIIKKDISHVLEVTTCVKDIIFKDKEKLIIELTDVIKCLLDIDPNELLIIN
jgi:hypothetical protein